MSIVLCTDAVFHSTEKYEEHCCHWGGTYRCSQVHSNTDNSGCTKSCRQGQDRGEENWLGNPQKDAPFIHSSIHPCWPTVTSACLCLYSCWPCASCTGFGTIALYLGHYTVPPVIYGLLVALAVISITDFLWFNNKPFAELYEKLFGLFMHEAEKVCSTLVLWN